MAADVVELAFDRRDEVVVDGVEDGDRDFIHVG